jgi:hypothetical protein
MPFPRRLAIGLGAWLLITVFGVEVWYRVHETREMLHWSFEAPTSKEDFATATLRHEANFDSTTFDSRDYFAV